MITIDKLADEIYPVFQFGIQEQKDFEMEFTGYLKKRAGLLLRAATHFHMEPHYVENEWKYMISMHYINTTYARQIQNDVIRIHFFDRDELCVEGYLGYITLRPIDELSIALSHIYVNWSKVRIPGTEEQYLMTIPKTVHIDGKEFSIETYPFFAQDRIVTCCVDANIIMMSKYLKEFIGSNGVGLPEVDGSFLRGNEPLPRVFEMKQVFDLIHNMKFPMCIRPYCYENYAAGKDASTARREKIEQNQQAFHRFLDSYIESGLPVMLLTSKHVIQLIGHAEWKGERTYIVYDDSGYLYKAFHVEPLEEMPFCYLMKLDSLFQVDGSNGTGFYLATPEFGRVYINQMHYEYFLKQYLNSFQAGQAGLKELPSAFSGWRNGSGQIRSLLVDNSVFKEHVKQHALPGEETQEVERLLHSPLPHYVWYTELWDENNELWFVCADPTCYFKTKDYLRLFLNFMPMRIDKPLSLLTGMPALDEAK